ncbi:TPA: transposase [Escherichia coli]|nr:transposase [Escherichia coli]
MLDVHPSGLYAWLQQPHSQRHQADLRLTGQIKQFWLESGCVYGYRKIHLDLRDRGQQYGVNRVWRLMKRIRKCLNYPWRFIVNQLRNSAFWFTS